MAQSYAPGLKVARQTRHRCRRMLPIPGEVLVRRGDRVDALDVVAQTSMPGDVLPVNLANVLAIAPGDVPKAMLKPVGAEVEVGEVIARTNGIFGFFKSEYRSKVAGTLETISGVTGQVIVRGAPIPVRVRAYLTGTVVEELPGTGVVIEADVSYIQGIFGIGGEAYGHLKLACRESDRSLTDDLITDDMQGCVIVGGARMTGAAVERARDVGAAAIVSGGIDDQDLKEILGYDLGVAVTGSEQIGITVIVTEGFGDIAMADRTFQLLSDREGDVASVNGTTQIRAGVLRPEIIVPIGASDASASGRIEPLLGVLEPGAPVRIIRDPYFGLIGEVAALPPELQVLDSGSKARVLEVALASGERVTVPRANVEIIGD